MQIFTSLLALLLISTCLVLCQHENQHSKQQQQRSINQGRSFGSIVTYILDYLHDEGILSNPDHNVVVMTLFYTGFLSFINIVIQIVESLTNLKGSSKTSYRSNSSSTLRTSRILNYIHNVDFDIS
uniref:Uncharacterized protein n=2 Tax=Lepeophtheirus salmonis TaxID=72036 RepID=A0A0K2TJX9_LEPSM|nr:uncharacterized protein LOC121128243 isoform X1 [Lepeophtheirus salmonis]